jgi:hypothetical protein
MQSRQGWLLDVLNYPRGTFRQKGAGPSAKKTSHKSIQKNPTPVAFEPLSPCHKKIVIRTSTSRFTKIYPFSTPPKTPATIFPEHDIFINLSNNNLSPFFDTISGQMFRGDSLFSTRPLEHFRQVVAREPPEKVSEKLAEIASTLCIAYFDPARQRYKKNLLPLILQHILPLTSHPHVGLRVHVESFLTRQYSLILAFCPNSLLTAYARLDTQTLQPAAQASIFIFWSSCLRFVPPRLRTDEVGTCLSILLSSEIELLTKVPTETWVLLRDSLPDRLLRSVLTDVLNKGSLTEPVSILCGRDPQGLLPVVLANYPLQFVKLFLSNWTVSKRGRIDLAWVSARLLGALESSDSGEISCALEIIFLLLTRLSDPPRDCPDWRKLFAATEAHWGLASATLAQKAKILDIFGAAVRCGILVVSEIKRFLSFASVLGPVLLVPIVRLATIFVERTRTIPHGLLDFLTRIALKRKPTLFIATINCLAGCFHTLHAIAPLRTERVLNLCLNPLPDYFVEQVAILQMFAAFDWSLFPVDKLRTKLVDIILAFTYRPHPSVIPEIVALLGTMSVELPYSRLDWFEDGASYLAFLPQVRFDFVLELLDMDLLPIAAVPEAVDSLTHSLTATSPETRIQVFSRALSIVLGALHALKLDFDGRKSLDKYKTDKWDHYCDPLPALLEHVDGYFPKTAFGSVLGASLGLVAEAVTQLRLSPSSAFAILSIAGFLGCTFTHACCRIIMKFAISNPDPKVQAVVSRFFALSFPFDCAVEVACAALDCLPAAEWPKLTEYFACAADIDRSVLLRWNPPNPQVFRTFLALKHLPKRQSYVKHCISALPFAEWVVVEDDFEFIGGLSDIAVGDEEALSPMHARLVSLFPSAFAVRGEAEVAGPSFSYSLNSATTLSVEVSDQYDADLPADSGGDTQIQAPLSPYLLRQPSHSDLFAYLWYSIHNRLDSEKWTDVQRYALSTRDSKFHVAFLGYALRHLLAVDTEAWARKIVVDRNDRTTYYSFAFFCNFIHKPWDSLTGDELALIGNSMTELGLRRPTPQNLLVNYRTKTGILKMVAEAVMAIDPTRFREFPLVEYVVSSRRHFFENFTGILETMAGSEECAVEALALFSRFLFPQLPHSLSEQFEIPPAVPQFEKFMPSQIEVSPFLRASVSEDIAELLVSFFENHRTCDSFFFFVLFHLDISIDRYERAIVPLREFTPSHNLHLHYALRRLASLDHSNEPIEHLKRPSYSRDFISLMTSPFAPTLSREIRNSILKSLTPVLFNLLPKGFETISTSVFDLRMEPVEESVLAVQPVSAESLARARSVFTVSPSMTCQVLDFLYQSQPEVLCMYFNTTSLDAAFVELSHVIVQILRTEKRYLKDTAQTMNRLLKFAPLVQLFMVFVSAEFLNAPEFANIFLMYTMFSRKIRDSEDDRMIANWKVVQELLPERVTNPARLEALQAENPLEVWIKLWEIP